MTRIHPRLSRRAVLAGLAAATVIGPAAGSARAQSGRRVRLYNAHTGERFDDVYHDGESYIDDALSTLDWLVRDHRQNVAAAMDPAVYDLLWTLGSRYAAARGARPTITVHSGFRTEETNQLLRTEGAAQNSFHLQGMAVDVSVQGLGINILANQALRIGAGGLGIYYRSGFVHLDTGRPRFWYRR
ncbi:MAG: DUF882 domain-containing protein [Alphaproteobacteria bacterium]